MAEQLQTFLRLPSWCIKIDFISSYTFVSVRNEDWHSTHISDVININNNFAALEIIVFLSRYRRCRWESYCKEK